jgi:hypothetical protein
VWRKWRGVRRLADDLAQTQAEHAELRRRVDAIEMIAAASDVAPIPPTLLAAARETRTADVPVRLDVAGTEVIAVVGGGGNPREWWMAIHRLSAPDEVQK